MFFPVSKEVFLGGVRKRTPTASKQRELPFTKQRGSWKAWAPHNFKNCCSVVDVLDDLVYFCAFKGEYVRVLKYFTI